MTIENESNQMVLFLNLFDLLLWNQGQKLRKNQSFTTIDEGFLERVALIHLATTSYIPRSTGVDIKD